MRLPRRPLGVVFDMDGLLVDSESLWRDAQLAEAEAMGAPMPLDVILSMVGLPWEQSQLKLVGHFGPDIDVEAYLARTIARAQTIRSEGAALKTGVIEILDLLDALAIPRAIATSSSHELVRTHLGGAHGLLPRFDAVVARGDYARGKPHPDPYLRAAERLGLAPAGCLALEDSHNGVRAGHAAGMMTVMVPDLLEATQEMHGLCVGVAPSLHQVREAIAAAQP